MICFKCKHFELQGTNIVCWKYDPVSIRDERTSCTDFEDKNDQKVREHIDSVLPDEICKWKNVGDYWETGCDGAFILSEGNPKDNSMKYCPYCGKEIKVIKS